MTILQAYVDTFIISGLLASVFLVVFAIYALKEGADEQS